MWVKLKYRTSVTLVSTVQAYDEHVFRGNSIFDPDVTSGTNGQPTGADQWAAFYARYYVAGSKIKIKAINKEASEVAQVMLWPSIQSTWDYATQSPTEYPYTKSTILAAAGSNNTAHMGHYMTTQKVYGRRGTEYESNFIGNLAATGGTNPTNDWYWILASTNPQGNNEIDMVVDVKLTYYVKMFNRIDITES